MSLSFSPSPALAPPPALPGGASPTVAWRYDAVLAGLIGRGHGLMAIVAFLAVSAEEVLERVVQAGLPTPHGRPLRMASRRPWYPQDIKWLIDRWLDGCDGATMAEVLGRTSDGIRGKARRLGLPQRARSSIRRPSAAKLLAWRELRPACWLTPTPQALLPLPSPQPPRPTPLDLAMEALTPCQRSRLLSMHERHDGSMLPILHLQGRGPRSGRGTEVDWTTELDFEVSLRGWAGQHHVGIAANLNLSPSAIRTRLCRLNIPQRDRSRLVEHYDHRLAQAAIARSGYRWRRCSFASAKASKPRWFWSRSAGDTVSPITRASMEYRAAA